MLPRQRAAADTGSRCRASAACVGYSWKFSLLPRASHLVRGFLLHGHKCGVFSKRELLKSAVVRSPSNKGPNVLHTPCSNTWAEFHRLGIAPVLDTSPPGGLADRNRAVRG